MNPLLPHSSPWQNLRMQRGLSLVLVLFAIVALSSLIVLYFSLASNDQAGTAAYTSSIKADDLASAGLELVIDELREEISDETKSAVNQSVQGGPTVYLPLTRQDILPQRTVPGTSPNLLKASFRNTPLFTGTGASLIGSLSPSTTPSRNGRAMTLERWSRPALVDFTSASVSPPDWIYLGRRGPLVDPPVSSASDSQSPDFVIGRLAFAVYDVGGLLDLNVAGYPAEMPAAEAGKKGSAALARLQSLGLSDAQVEAIIAFRNPSTRASYQDHLHGGHHNAFTRTVPGDNRFFSRQELIRFAKRHGFGDGNQNLLDRLTIFSREKNAPSYEPLNPTSSNPSLASVRHTATGRLLFEKRFPLSKLDLFQDPSSNAPDIEKYFGLTYLPASRSFVYKAATIKSFSQIAAETDWREMDFFEVLKTTIGSGSIGQSAGTTASVSDDPDKDTHIMQIGANIIDQYDLDPDTNAAGPIPIPTTITFGSKTLYGQENLPYVNKISILGEQIGGGAGAPDDGIYTGKPNAMKVGKENSSPTNNKAKFDRYGFVAAAELWNPNFQRLPSDSPPADVLVRAKIQGSTQVTMYASPDTSDNSTPGGTGNATPPLAAPVADLSTSSPVEVKGSNNSLGSANIEPEYQYNHFNEPHLVRLGVAMNQIIYDKDTNQNDDRTFCFKSARITIHDPLSVELAVQDGNGVFRTYQKTLDSSLPFLEISKTTTPNGAAPRLNRATSLAHSDPRTNRLGYFGLNYSPDAKAPDDDPPESNAWGSAPSVQGTAFAANRTYPFSLRPRMDKIGGQYLLGDPSGFGVAVTHGTPAAAYHFDSHIYLGLLWENNNTATKISDPDGTFRPGDGGFAPNDSNNVLNPMEPAASFRYRDTGWPTDNRRLPGINNSRPVILNRPFRSVADLGYVHRDIPWRSLNFSGTDSADAGLLDVMSLEDTAVIAGRVNPNSASPAVLQSLIAGSVKEERFPSSALSNAQAQAAAVRFGEFLTTSGPIVNIADFVTRFSTPTNFTTAEFGTGSGGEASFAVKTQRESLIRALAGSTQTRTWNIMIDLVAQTGRFPRDAANLDAFVAEAEQRYWLHIAIDRYTGEIVGEMIEKVSE